VPHATACGPVTYYALDLEERELQRTLADISMSDIGNSLRGKIETKGICGTYDDGLKFVEKGGLFVNSISTTTPVFGTRADLRDSSPSPSPVSSILSVTTTTDEDTPPSSINDIEAPLHILFLGSSLGNFTREAQADFLRSLPLRPGSGDTLLLGLDHDNSKEAIEEAYNDPRGYTKQFIMNALRVAGRALGDESMFDEDKWEYVNYYNVVSCLIQRVRQCTHLCVPQEKRMIICRFSLMSQVSTNFFRSTRSLLQVKARPMCTGPFNWERVCFPQGRNAEDRRIFQGLS
jgi:L-histidine Nalpha-methyltransferase / hercynylcysteine S-oxide synthase